MIQTDRDDRRRIVLARSWWALGLRGAFAILFGLLALLWPGITLASLIFLFAIYMLADAVAALVAAVRAVTHHTAWGLLVLEAALDLLAGLIALLAPLATLVAFVWLTAVWALASGAVLLWAALWLHGAHGRWLLGLGGVFSLLWGGLLLANPTTGAVVMTWWLGAYALVFGGTLLTAAWRLRRRRVV
jgi:uncharacterized membrane protein HdeD (DUF308 family)